MERIAPAILFIQRQAGGTNWHSGQEPATHALTARQTNGREPLRDHDELTSPEVIQALTKAEQEVRRSINPSVYGVKDWRRKLAEDGGFVKRVMEQPRIFLIGSDEDLPKPR